MAEPNASVACTVELAGEAFSGPGYSPATVASAGLGPRRPLHALGSDCVGTG